MPDGLLAVDFFDPTLLSAGTPLRNRSAAPWGEIVRPDLSVMAAAESFPGHNGASTLDAAFSIPALS